ncbi:MAG: rod shape-determining protein MreD [Candidatus Zixiibacteriota bacterium]|nr:MAG: rod shape-determining protein MreD [candidate division Zixibacteria bacterium]
MIRVIPFLLYLWLVALHQVVLDEVISIYGVGVNLPVLLVLLVGLYKSELDTCWFAFFVGMVAFGGLTDMMGWHALVMAIIGYLAYHTRVKINLESRYSKLLLVFIGAAVHNTAVLVMGKSDGVFYLLGTQAITGALYTTVVAWVFFLFEEGKITFQKFKAIF